MGEDMSLMAASSTQVDATRDEFDRQFARCEADGLVDFKAMVNLNNDTITRELMWTAANALRLLHEGNLRPYAIVQPRS